MTSSMSEASTLKETPCSSIDVSHQLLGIDWDPCNAAAAAQDVNFNITPPSHLYDVGLIHSQGIHCSSVSLLDPFPRFPCYNNDSFVEHISSFAHSGDGSVANPDVPSDLHSKRNQDVEKDFNGKKRKNLADTESFISQSSLHKFQNVQSEEQNNPPLETAEVEGVKDDKRQVSGGSPWKTSLKQHEEQPQNSDAPKEDYIHVRAKRGQATNSHSLAERVRREKISDRMRFLQNLVPGCSKITGKAVMLDEIINYVQSLQRQVEFLSMKLATVSPEMNFDIEQILPKDILNSRVGNSAALMFDPGMNIPNSHLPGFIPQTLSRSEMAIHSVPSHIYHMPQASGLWEDEFQNIFQMGASPNVHFNNTEQQPGSTK